MNCVCACAKPSALYRYVLIIKRGNGIIIYTKTYKCCPIHPVYITKHNITKLEMTMRQNED